MNLKLKRELNHHPAPLLPSPHLSDKVVDEADAQLSPCGEAFSSYRTILVAMVVGASLRETPPSIFRIRSVSARPTKLYMSSTEQLVQFLWSHL